MNKIYLVLLLIFFDLMVNAQNTTQQLITVNFQQADIKQVVAALEVNTGYMFYYNAAQFDSLKVTLQATRQPLQTILDSAFRKTDFHYTVTQNNQVFLTKGRTINTQLAPGFFNLQPPPGTHSNAANAAVLAAYTDVNGEKKVPDATSENKIYNIGIPGNRIIAGTATLAGYLRDVSSGEPVIGASIYVPASQKGVNTDQFGYYSITLPRGQQTLVIRGLGMTDTRRQVVVYGDGKLNIEMKEQVTTLKEVKISAVKVANVRNLEMGVNKLDIKTIKQVPTVFGENDVLRVLTTLPGVQTVGEASTGLNVRGGAADQNLILLNDATIYNPSHFFGFFSAFDPDLVQSVELFKSSIPEKYGGRLSSVLDVTNREGNTKHFTGSAGIGLLTSRLYVEGPIDSNTSFIFGGRTTYANWLLQLLPAEYKNSSASFYDINLDLTHKIDEKDNLYLTTYLSNDNFRLASDTTYKYSNRNASLKWRHTFNNKLYSVVIAGFDSYQYSIDQEGTPTEASLFSFNIKQYNLRTDFSYYLNPKNTLSFGLSTLLYNLNAGTSTPVGTMSLSLPESVPAEQALESAVYAGDKIDLTTNLSVDLGVRLSVYNYLGPQTVYEYAPGLPTTIYNRVDSVTYGKNQVIKTYGGPEIRASARYILSDNTSVKASYNTLRQYIHLLSNTTAISPTDVYKLSDPNIKPEYGDQVSLGLYHNLSDNTIETSVEVYYKHIEDYLDYRSGAVLILNPHIENDVLPVHGKAYGAEFFLKKTTGKLNGWISYTYSRTFLQQNDPNAGELINGGQYYPADYDKPNAVNLIGNYRFTHRYSISLNTIYSTGRPITLPIAKFFYDGSERVYYSARNQYRIPDYFRTDFSATFEPNHKVHQRLHNSFTIGVYNVTGRHNPYSVYYQSEGGKVDGYQLSIFATAIPFINYDVRF